MRFSILLSLLVLVFSAHGQAPPTIDGYTYKTVKIGDQEWFAENLRTKVYANGDVIPVVLTDDQWTSTRAGATTVYGEGSSECDDNGPNIDACDEAQSLAAYGRLYNWYAVDDERGLCPSGWHVPTKGEWMELRDYIRSQGFFRTEGTALKSTTGWLDNGNGTDDFGFSGRPGGVRNSIGFSSTGYRGYFWSSSPNATGNNLDFSTVGDWWTAQSIGGTAWMWDLNYGNPRLWKGSSNRRNGFSVRCLRDAE